MPSADDEDEDDYDPSQLGTDFLPGGGVDDYTEAKEDPDRAAPLPGVVGSFSEPVNGPEKTDSTVPLKKVLAPAPSTLANTLLAITHAPATASPAEVRDASIMGFLYVADVDVEKGKIRVLAPVGGRMPSRAIIWAKRWPGELVGLVG